MKMQEKKVKYGSDTIHMIKTDQFRTITIKVVLKEKVAKDRITMRNFLTSMLTDTTLKYPTKRLLIKEAEDLYNVDFHILNRRLGKYSNTNITMSLLNEKYTEEGMLEKSIEFLSEILFHPNIKNNQFNQKSFEFIMENSKKAILGMEERKEALAVVRMMEKMGYDPLTYRDYGYVEDLEKITPQNLVPFYKEWIKKAHFDIYVLGDISFSKIESLFKKYFPIETYKKEIVTPFLDPLPKRRKVQTVVETDEVEQAKLVIGCVVDPLEKYMHNYVWNLYTIILGASPDSKFFKNIREKHSVCYYVNASMRKFDHLLLIRAGIDESQFKKTVSLIKKEMKAMAKGDFSLEDIEKAKKLYISLLDEMNDNPNELIESYISSDLSGIGSIEERKKEILKVTKENIVEMAKKVHFDTIYLLKGENHGRD